jgi:hypothetical protein
MEAHRTITRLSGLRLVYRFWPVAAVLGFMYTIGQRTSKINEVVIWKNETAPRIEKMDMQGSVSFLHFHTQYEKEQQQQYDRLKELEKDMRQQDVMKQKIEAMERVQLDRNPRYQPPESRRP